MKKLGKLSINPEKLMKNEELMSLRGGYGGYGGSGDCGEGFMKYLCDITPCDGCSEQTGLIACVKITQEIIDYVEKWWPDATAYSCKKQ